MKKVTLCIIEDNDEGSFCNNAGVSVNIFLEILSLYLNSTIVEWEGIFHLQFSSICRGSKFAPVLIEIFIGSVDRSVQVCLKGLVFTIIRYIDNCLVFVQASSFEQTVTEIIHVFKKCDVIIDMWGLMSQSTI